MHSIEVQKGLTFAALSVSQVKTRALMPRSAGLTQNSHSVKTQAFLILNLGAQGHDLPNNLDRLSVARFALTCEVYPFGVIFEVRVDRKLQKKRSVTCHDLHCHDLHGHDLHGHDLHCQKKGHPFCKPRH